MANPKHRHSRTRGRKRRTHDSLTSPQHNECPNCHEPKLPHVVCPHCGHYKGVKVIGKEE
ncbi:MAG TPA: 50S ribosomal protein L32 [bacterium]|nr:50S ribosomal protein L32 [bacterium]